MNKLKAINIGFKALLFSFLCFLPLFSLRLLQGRGSSNGATGPSRDHSSYVSGGISGGYVYISSAFPARPGDRARLQSPALATTSKCALKAMKWCHLGEFPSENLQMRFLQNAMFYRISWCKRTQNLLKAEILNFGIKSIFLFQKCSF